MGFISWGYDFFSWHKPYIFRILVRKIQKNQKISSTPQNWLLFSIWCISFQSFFYAYHIDTHTYNIQNYLRIEDMHIYNI